MKCSYCGRPIRLTDKYVGMRESDYFMTSNNRIAYVHKSCADWVSSRMLGPLQYAVNNFAEAAKQLMARHAGDSQLFAMTTKSGTACPETCLCQECIKNEFYVDLAKKQAHDDVEWGEFHEVSRNEYCHCIVCGAGKWKDEDKED